MSGDGPPGGADQGEGEAVSGEAVGIGAAGALDQSVAAEPGEVVGGLAHGVGDAAQSGHPGTKALVRDAGDDEVPYGEATGQGLHPGVREAHGRDPPPRRVCGGVRDPLDDWIREDAAALAGNYSIHQPGVACTRFGRQFVQVLQAALAAQVTGVVDDGLYSERAVFLQVDLDPRVLEAQVDGDLVAAVEQPGGEDAGRLAGDPGAEDDLHVLGAAQADVAGQQFLEHGPDPAGSSKTRVRETSICRMASCHQQPWSRSASVSGSGIRFIHLSKNTRIVPAWTMSHSSCSRAGSEVAANPLASGVTAMPSASAARRAISWPLHQTLTGYGA